MVGTAEERLPFTNPFWGGLEPNHVGTDEFLHLMELVKGEPLLEVNLIGGTPERAAAWVEYCNGNEHTLYGRKRARNGHPKPYGVTYWELDNEVWRRFSAAQYAAECLRYATAMRAVDPNIKLMAVSYFWKDDAELETLLKGAAQAIDYLAVRTVDRDEMSKFVALADKYSTPPHKLLIASTEWRNKWRKDAWSPSVLDGSQRQAEMMWGYAFECGAAAGIPASQRACALRHVPDAEQSLWRNIVRSPRVRLNARLVLVVIVRHAGHPTRLFDSTPSRYRTSEMVYLAVASYSACPGIPQYPHPLAKAWPTPLNRGACGSAARSMP